MEVDEKGMVVMKEAWLWNRRERRSGGPNWDAGLGRCLCLCLFLLHQPSRLDDLLTTTC